MEGLFKFTPHNMNKVQYHYSAVISTFKMFGPEVDYLQDIIFPHLPAEVH